MSKLGFLIAIAVIAAGLDGARADTYPSHVVKIIVPIAAGGPIDTVARTIAQTLSERLKQPFIVENRPGAGGNVGIQAAIHAEPDGYTLLLAAGSMLTISPLLYKVQPFDPEVDMQPLSILTVSSQTLVVHPSLPVNSLRDLVAYAKKKPLAYATSGYGSPSHLAMEYLRLLADFPAAPVSYRGLLASHGRPDFRSGEGGFCSDIGNHRIRARWQAQRDRNFERAALAALEGCPNHRRVLAIRIMSSTATS